MNPFNEIIESTCSFPTMNAIDSSGALELELEDEALTPNTIPYRSRYNNNDTTKKDPVFDVVAEEEVYALLFRLKQIVGDVDMKPVLDKVNELREKNKNKVEKIIPNTSFKQLNIQDKSNGKIKTAHFALTSPVIMNRPAEDNLWDSNNTLDEDIESGATTARSTKYSRYSLGSNRFSLKARQISLGTLNYVGGNKLLRPQTRPSLASPDPYAFMSPNKLAKSRSLSADALAAASLDESFHTHNIGDENFVEFCVVGVQSDILNGLKSLENTSLQPTERLDVFPVDREAVVGNLHEYCFPYGAELKYVTRKDLDRLSVGLPSTARHSKPRSQMNTTDHRIHHHSRHHPPSSTGSVVGLQYQIMQFTDAEGVTYYAVCVISDEPVEQVGEALQTNMDALQNSIAASNTIKRYLAYYSHKKKQLMNTELDAQWAENIKKSRIKSIFSTATTYHTDSKGENKSNKSIFKALKKAIGVSFKPSKTERGDKTTWLSSAVSRTHNRSTSNEKCSDDSPIITGRKYIDTPDSGSRDDGVKASPGLPPIGSPQLLQRQRSHSFSSPGVAASINFSRDERDSRDDIGSSLDTSTTLSLALGAAEVGVDGSPCRSRALLHKLGHSNRKVAIVTQRAYCIVTEKPYHALFFQILEAIALKERERALTRCSFLSSHLTSSSGSPRLAVASISANGMREIRLTRETSDGSTAHSVASMNIHTARRNEFLAYLQQHDFTKQLRLFDQKSRPVSTARLSAKSMELAGGDYLSGLRVFTRLLSLKEWTVALLVSIIPSELVVRIHSLVLQELSLLVYGSDPAMVTAIATAFNLLLQPFSWEGIFVPLLPTAAFEALDAPVPFIIGVVSRSRPAAAISTAAGLLCLDDFIHHADSYVPNCCDESTLRHTLATREDIHQQPSSRRPSDLGSDDALLGDSNRTLRFFESPCPEETQQGVTPLLDPMQCAHLKDLHQFIAYHAVKIKASLKALHVHHRPADAFCATTTIKAVLLDLSDEAQRSVNHILTRMHSYNSSLCGEVLTQPGGWRQFGVLNSRSNQFEFLPDLFLAPQKANLRLQECVINTQLFVSFMDEQSEAYLKLQPQRQFISDWLYFRIMRQKQTKRRSARRIGAY